ncbi:unnamed protein product [Fusarium graminearum]|nr:unnamed protein product [Fusarium graminearum]CAG1964984.1 unnamed protein product [Fusarium graminearum]CAG1999100.1 unnamed protein product [Fusarium graminearum]
MSSVERGSERQLVCKFCVCKVPLHSIDRSNPDTLRGRRRVWVCISDIIASTRTVKRREAASTSTGPGETSTSSPPESVPGRQAASNVRVLGLLSVVVTLL